MTALAPSRGLALARPMRWGAGLQLTDTAIDSSFMLPAGTVTFVLTDIEGSTRLWESEPEATAEAVPMHYRLLSDAIGRHGGVRPVEQGEGDSVVAAFSRASDAVAAALEAQRSLARQVWPDGVELRVRIALHTAEAQLRDEGNYFGVALNRCARLRAIANGGQTLLSRAVHDLVLERLPDGVELVDLGMHRLRDLGRPEHVFALSHPDLPDSALPLRSLDALPNNLPEQLTSFVGRERELEEIKGALGATRMLTLIGAGGCGKTRLAGQVAADLLESFPDGCWWVELAPLADPDAVGPALADALAVRPLPGQTSLDAVVGRLVDADAMVVLDNCEHLLDACAHAAEAVLRGCHQVTVLATSRAPLDVAGETTWRVPSLSLPQHMPVEPVDAVAQSDAVRLFIERALKVRPNFAVDARNAPSIAQICFDLDGIPLAIELAAARVRVLSVEQIAQGLGDRFRLLTGGARSAMPRQQTLRASVDWSHELLSHEECVLFRRLAVFAGGWTLDAVEDVCAGDGVERLSVLDLLTSLVDKSLVVVDDGATSARYRLLETVRQYSHDRLIEAGEQVVVRARHRDCYLQLAEHIAPRVEAAGQRDWLDALDREAANLAAAGDHAADTDGELALRLCVALTVWWKLRGSFTLADTAYRRALEAASREPSRLRARVLWARGYLLAYAGRLDEAMASAVEALEFAERLDDPSTAARALDVIGTVRMLPDPVGVRPGLERARELALASGDEWCFVDATQVLGMTLIMQADAGAVGILNEALDIIERTGYAEFAAWHWFGVGWVRHFQGCDEEALALYGRAIEVADAVGEPVSSGMAHALRAMLRADRGDGAAGLAELGPVTEASIAAGAGLAIPPLRAALNYVGACVEDVEAARISAAHRVEAALARHGSGGANDLQAGPSGAYGQAFGLSILARIELAAGDRTAAADHARLAAQITDRRLANPLIGAAARRYLATAELARGEVSDAERLAQEALAIAIEHQFAADVFPALDILAQAAAAVDSVEEAARILGAAERARTDRGRVRWKHEQSAIDELRERLRLAIGEDRLAAEIDAGRALSTDDAVAWLRRARGTRKRPAGGWESLTPTERRVVALAAEGLTNPEIGERMFIARGTVKIHLSHIYAKLGVRNRSELVGLAARRTG